MIKQFIYGSTENFHWFSKECQIKRKLIFYIKTTRSIKFIYKIIRALQCSGLDGARPNNQLHDSSYSLWTNRPGKTRIQIFVQIRNNSSQDSFLIYNINLQF